MEKIICEHKFQYLITFPFFTAFLSRNLSTAKNGLIPHPQFLHNKKESLLNDKNKYRKLIFNKIEADQCHLQKVLLLAL